MCAERDRDRERERERESVSQSVAERDTYIETDKQ